MRRIEEVMEKADSGLAEIRGLIKLMLKQRDEANERANNCRRDALAAIQDAQTARAQLHFAVGRAESAERDRDAKDRRIAELTDALQRCDQIDQWSMESDTKVWVAVCGYCGAVSTDMETPVPHDEECPTAIARAALSGKGVSRG